MEENERIELSGVQFAAIAAAFEEHKKTRGLPASLKAVTRYDIRVESTKTTYAVRFMPQVPGGSKEKEPSPPPRFSAGYILDKRSLKVLQRVRIG